MLLDLAAYYSGEAALITVGVVMLFITVLHRKYKGSTVYALSVIAGALVGLAVIMKFISLMFVFEKDYTTAVVAILGGSALILRVPAHNVNFTRVVVALFAVVTFVSTEGISYLGVYPRLIVIMLLCGILYAFAVSAQAFASVLSDILNFWPVSVVLAVTCMAEGFCMLLGHSSIVGHVISLLP